MNSQSGDVFRKLQECLRYDLGTHKTTRLRQAGRTDSGTLLHAKVADQHSRELLLDFKAHCGDDMDQERLRFLTILHQAIPCVLPAVAESVDEMRQLLVVTLQGAGVWALGAIEIEIVSVDFLRRFERQGIDTKRKLQTVLALANNGEFHTLALIHCHILVDLGEAASASERALRDALRNVEAWSHAPYQIELKSTFRNRSLTQNLKGIADYLTKGGNEQLRYKAGYGRDFGEDLDAKIWRAGLGRKDCGADTIEDDRGLSVGEVRILDQAYDMLMGSGRDRRGYLIGVGN